MAQVTKNIGKIPVGKGAWVQGSYNRLNEVLLFGSTFRSKIDNNTNKPAEIVEGKLVVNQNWDVVSNGTDAFLASSKIASLEKDKADKTELEKSNAQIAQLEQKANVDNFENIKADNLSNTNSYKDGYGIDSNGMIVYMNNMNITSDYIRVDRSEMYSVCVIDTRVGRFSTVYIVIGEYDNNLSFIKKTTVSKFGTLLLSDNTYYVAINVSNSIDVGLNTNKEIVDMLWFSKTENASYVCGRKKDVRNIDLKSWVKEDGYCKKSTIVNGENVGTIALSADLAIDTNAQYKEFILRIKSSSPKIIAQIAKQSKYAYWCNSYGNGNKHGITDYYYTTDGWFNVHTSRPDEVATRLRLNVQTIGRATYDEDITVEVELYSNDKPVDKPTRDYVAEKVRVSEAYVNNQIENKTASYFNENINNQVAAYIAQNINDFKFTSPYITAITTLQDLKNLNTASSGKMYSIVSDIDLSGQTIDLISQGAKDVTLVFDGGVISNGKINPNNTSCIFNFLRAFKNVEFLGRFKNTEIDIRHCGAACDGVDGGIGDFTKDDSYAINQAINFAPVVIVPSGFISIVKKPILMKSNTNLVVNGTIKQGDASNCTLIKNKGIDIPSDGKGNETYPAGYTRDCNITISGSGVIDGNGWMQNRGSSSDVGDNPDVYNTPQFKDGDNMDYIGFMIKLADIDNLIVRDVTLRNPRTYAFCLAGLKGYKLHGLYADRTFKNLNQDFIHIHGKSFDGEIFDCRGVSGDDFIAVTTMEAGALSIRVGDVKRLNIHNITYWGLNPNATTSNTIELSDGNGIEDGYNCHRLLRLSYTDEIIDDITVTDCFTTQSKLGGQVVLSNLPFKPKDNGKNGYGSGKIGKVYINNLIQSESWGLIDTSDYLNVDNLIIENIIDKKTTMNNNGGIIRFAEAFDSPAATSASNSIIENLTVRNYFAEKGFVHPLPNGYIDYDGHINNIDIDNFAAKLIKGNTVNWGAVIRCKSNKINIKNSDFSIFDNFTKLINTDSVLFESNNVYKSGYACPQQFKRAIAMTLPLSVFPSAPINGDMVRKIDGMYILKNNSWVL
ncbi:MAG: hypothetical protein ACRCXV_00460 [Bacteroidales bacterium]